ncbi:MAG TPA: hypothetical protein VNZ61_20960 [Roseomonas sp.]|nr:hypothetical protein [Roseomonas sp.]
MLPRIFHRLFRRCAHQWSTLQEGQLQARDNSDPLGWFRYQACSHCKERRLERHLL